MIRDIVKKNQNVTIDSIRKEKMKEVIDKFTDAKGNFDLENFKKYVENVGKNVIKEGYSLNFLGKRASELLSGLESTTIFVPDTEHNNKEENKNSENIYISADNLEALRHLKNSYHGAIKCIYIDPPYNTGSDGFCYNDKFGYDKETLSEKLGINIDEAERILSMQSNKSNSHSAWLSFMYARLLIAYDLLKKEGIIFISIDEHEMANLKLLCDEIFGEENFVSSLIWKCRDSLQHDEVLISSQTERILVYVKNNALWNRAGLKLNRVRKPFDDIAYDNPDNDPRGPWLSSGKTRDDGRPSYTVISPTGKQFTKPWVPSPDEFKRWEENGLIWWGKNGDAIPRKKSFLKDFKGNAISDICFDEFTDEIVNGKIKRTKRWEVGTTESASEKLKKMFDDRNCFSYPKPVNLIKYLLTISTNESDTIIDFFSGSATTAQAIMELNSKDFKNRKYILIQFPESLDETIKTSNNKSIILNQIKLCDEIKKHHSLDMVGIERIIRSANNIKDETSADIDYGFKHYTLIDKKETLDKLESFDLNMAIVSQDSILSEFSIESRLITFLCDDGFGLTAKYEPIDLDGYEAYLIEGFLYLLDKNFDSKQIIELIEKVDKKEIEIKKIVVFGYAFDTRSLQQLKDNAEKMGIDDSKDIIIKY